MKRVRTVIFGTPACAAQLLRAAAAWPYLEIVAVVTESAKPAGRGRQLTPSPVSIAAHELNIPSLTPSNSVELQAALGPLSADLGLLLAYGRLLPGPVCRSFARGIINLHPSLLPRYRGPAPVYWTIRHGDERSGVSIMLLDDGCDTGPLLAQEEVVVSAADTAGSLLDRLVERGLALMNRILPSYLNGEIEPKPQTGSHTMTRKVQSDDGALDWRASDIEIDRQVRAGQPGPRCFTDWRGRRLIITAGTLVEGRWSPTRVQPAGRREMSWIDFCRGQHLEPAAAINELRGA